MSPRVLSTTSAGGRTPLALGNNPAEIQGPPTSSPPARTRGAGQNPQSRYVERGGGWEPTSDAMVNGASEAPHDLTRTSWGGLSASGFQATRSRSRRGRGPVPKVFPCPALGCASL